MTCMLAKLHPAATFSTQGTKARGSLAVAISCNLAGKKLDIQIDTGPKKETFDTSVVLPELLLPIDQRLLGYEFNIIQYSLLRPVT